MGSGRIGDVEDHQAVGSAVLPVDRHESEVHARYVVADHQRELEQRVHAAGQPIRDRERCVRALQVERVINQRPVNGWHFVGGGSSVRTQNVAFIKNDADELPAALRREVVDELVRVTDCPDQLKSRQHAGLERRIGQFVTRIRKIAILITVRATCSQSWPLKFGTVAEANHANYVVRSLHTGARPPQQLAQDEGLQVDESDGREIADVEVTQTRRRPDHFCHRRGRRQINLRRGHPFRRQRIADVNDPQILSHAGAAKTYSWVEGDTHQLAAHHGQQVIGFRCAVGPAFEEIVRNQRQVARIAGQRELRHGNRVDRSGQIIHVHRAIQRPFAFQHVGIVAFDHGAAAVFNAGQ